MVRLLDRVDLTPPEEVIQSTHSIPAIPVGLNDNPVPATIVAMTVLVPQQIHEQPLSLILQTNRETDLVGLGIEIMHEEYPVIPPSVAHHEDCRIAGGYD